MSEAIKDYYTNMLKGTCWQTPAGELVLQRDFRFCRDHGFPQKGTWEVGGPNILWLRADDDDTDRSKSEAFGIQGRVSRLMTCLDRGGFDYEKHPPSDDRARTE